MNSIGIPKQVISLVLSIVLILTVAGPGVTDGMAYQAAPASTPAPATSGSEFTGQGEPATAEELQSLVAPIALYPDALVAQNTERIHVP